MEEPKNVRGAGEVTSRHGRRQVSREEDPANIKAKAKIQDPRSACAISLQATLKPSNKTTQ